MLRSLIKSLETKHLNRSAELAASPGILESWTPFSQLIGRRIYSFSCMIKYRRVPIRSFHDERGEMPAVLKK